MNGFFNDKNYNIHDEKKYQKFDKNLNVYKNSSNWI